MAIEISSDLKIYGINIFFVFFYRWGPEFYHITHQVYFPYGTEFTLEYGVCNGKSGPGKQELTYVPYMLSTYMPQAISNQHADLILSIVSNESC